MASIFQNACKPEGFWGRFFVFRMNIATHARLAEWGFSLLKGVPEGTSVLDAGCGGGGNVARWIRLFRPSKTFGLDYSQVSVRKSRSVNRKAIKEGRAEIFLADISAIPLPDGSLDCVSAFETIYFWPDILADFKEVRRVLKDGGVFLICNESNGLDEGARKMTGIIEGMNLYDAKAISSLLGKAGFGDISINEHPENHWLCILARK